MVSLTWPPRLTAEMLERAIAATDRLINVHILHIDDDDQRAAARAKLEAHRDYLRAQLATTTDQRRAA